MYGCKPDSPQSKEETTRSFTYRSSTTVYRKVKNKPPVLPASIEHESSIYVFIGRLYAGAIATTVVFIKNVLSIISMHFIFYAF